MSRFLSLARRAPPRLRTARCILRAGDEFLMVVHSGVRNFKRAHWGLPGGHIEYGEAPEDAVRRELQEELRIAVTDLGEVGDYRYKGALHRVYTAAVAPAIEWFDRAELLEVAWHPLDTIERFAAEGRLHAGYEAEAIRLLARSTRRALGA